MVLHLLEPTVLRGGWNLDMRLQPQYLRRIRSPPYPASEVGQPNYKGREDIKSICPIQGGPGLDSPVDPACLPQQLDLESPKNFLPAAFQSFKTAGQSPGSSSEPSNPKGSQAIPAQFFRYEPRSPHFSGVLPLDLLFGLI